MPAEQMSPVGVSPMRRAGLPQFVVVVLALCLAGAGWSVGQNAARVERAEVVLSRGVEKQAALESLLAAQQNPASAEFHRWLTPEEFGARFGPSDAEVARVTAWLAAQGFDAIRVNAGRTRVEFSGSAAAYEAGFGAGARVLPAGMQAALPRRVAAAARPSFTYSPASGTKYAITPNDFATIYDVLPLWNAAAPIDGTGVTIAVAGDTDINPADFVSFRTLFGLPLGNTATATGTQFLNIIYNGTKPDFRPDEGHADADTQWAAAVAKGATIDYVATQQTEASSGMDLSAAYIVDNNLAPILVYSYATCELALGTAGNAFFASLWQQAAAQGIAVVTASGDAAAAGCDAAGAAASGGKAVNGAASTPYSVTVGGTEFSAPNGLGAYFNATNNAAEESAKGYIPELAWNDSCTNPAVLAAAPYVGLTAEQACNSAAAAQAGLVTVAGTGGGASSCTASSGTLASCSGGYAKPVWQVAAGVPADGVRDVPDVALFASKGRTGSFYLVCQQSANADGRACNLSAPYADFVEAGGTEVAAPAFAGVLALAAQKAVQAGAARLGNPDFALYGLANQQAGLNCSSSGSPAAGCVFHTVALGTNAMPCMTGSPDCATATAGDAYGVLSVAAPTGVWNAATGLGSVDAANLVAGLTSLVEKTTSAVLSITPSSIVHGSAVTATVTMAGTPAPTGQVSVTGQVGNGAVGFGSLVNGQLVESFRGFPGGSYGVQAHYAGDGTYAAADSNFVSLNVTPEPSGTTLRTLVLDPVTRAVTNVQTAPYGSIFYFRADVAGQSGQGVATGDVSIAVNGAPLGVGVYRLNSSGYTEAQNDAITPGQYSFSASYGGDASFLASTAAAAGLTVTRAATSAAVSTNAATVSAGGVVTLSAVISSGSFGYLAPGGTVTFLSGGTVLGIAALSPGQDPTTFLDKATAVMTISAGQLATGADSISVSYAGDADYFGSSSAATPLTVTPSPLAGTTVTVSVSPANVAPGGSVLLSATVAPAGATGAVQFAVDGGNAGAPVTLGGGAASLVFSVTGLKAGSHAVSAVYLGDADYASSASGGASFLIASPGLQSVPMVSVAPANAVQGTFLSVSAQVSAFMPAAGNPAVTGTVQLVVDGARYGSPQTLVNGAATLPLPTGTIQVGTHQLTIFYAGDGNYVPSYAAPVGFALSAPGATPTVVTLSGLPAQIVLGAGANFTASVSPASPSPTGVFQIAIDGGTPGAPILLHGAVNTLSLPAAGLTLGAHTVAVFYSGDATYGFSTSAAASYTVVSGIGPVQGSFTFALGSAQVTAQRLGSARATLGLTFQATGGFAGTVTAVCTAGLPINTSCTFAPGQVVLAPNGSGTSTLTLVLNTGISTASLGPSWMARSASVVAFAALLMVGFGRRRRWVGVVSVSVLACLLGVAGCSDGYAFGSTPPGTYMVTLTATSGKLTQTGQFTLVVQ